jgi:hypothetical protein
MTIFAVTHGGVPRSEGGKLICYQVGNLQIFPGFPVQIVLLPTSAASQRDAKLRRRAALPSYLSLPGCQGYFQDLCSDHYCREETLLKQKEYREGMCFVRVCSSCGLIHKRRDTA